jgi:hypothetical protein
MALTVIDLGKLIVINRNILLRRFINNITSLIFLNFLLAEMRAISYYYCPGNLNGNESILRA